MNKEHEAVECLFDSLQRDVLYWANRNFGKGDSHNCLLGVSDKGSKEGNNEMS